MSKITRGQNATKVTFLILLALCGLTLAGGIIFMVGVAMYKMAVLFYILGIFGAIFLLWCAVYGYFCMVPSKHVIEKDI